MAHISQPPSDNATKEPTDATKKYADAMKWWPSASDSVIRNGGLDLRFLLKDPKYCDVRVTVEDTVFSLHRSVLVATSGFFHKIFANLEEGNPSHLGNIPDINIQGLKSDVFLDILEWMYSGQTDGIEDAIFDFESAILYMRTVSFLEVDLQDFVAGRGASSIQGSELDGLVSIVKQIAAPGADHGISLAE